MFILGRNTEFILVNYDMKGSCWVISWQISITSKFRGFSWCYTIKNPKNNEKNFHFLWIVSATPSKPSPFGFGRKCCYMCLSKVGEGKNWLYVEISAVKIWKVHNGSMRWQPNYISPALKAMRHKLFSFIICYKMFI
jgi:hypothetical protein